MLNLFLNRERLLAFLYFASGDIRKHHGALGLGYSPDTYVKSIDMTIEVLYKTIVKKHVKLPSKREAQKEARLFAKRLFISDLDF